MRHLKCDSLSPCAECEKSGRACVRLNVRFRNLVCPVEGMDSLDSRRYEFAFDSEQKWVATNQALEFVHESDVNDDTSPMNEPVTDFTDSVSLNTYPSLTAIQQPPSSSVIESASDTPTLQASLPDDDMPGSSTALDPVAYRSPRNGYLAGTLHTPANSSSVSQLDDDLPLDSRESYPERILLAPKVAWPLDSLQEGRLLQHFVIHIAPWVCSSTSYNLKP